VVRGDPRFIEFFQSATPVNELGRMNIGSRPAKRKAAGSIDQLRAIPWIFAWTQTRFHLPVWLGIGDAFQVCSCSVAGATLLNGPHTSNALRLPTTHALLSTLAPAQRTLQFLCLKSSAISRAAARGSLYGDGQGEGPALCSTASCTECTDGLWM
jgi:hypothetical protein